MADADLILRNLLEKIASEQNYDNNEIEVTKLENEGANFTSFLYRATISSKGKDDLKLFAKVGAIPEALRAHAERIFVVEGYFYENLLAKYKKLEEDHSVEKMNRLVTPKCYGVHSTLCEETIVFEDLTCKGFTTLDRFEILSYEYTTQAINELAKLHALSFAYAKDDPDGFVEDLVTLKFQMPMPPEMMHEMFGGLVQNALAMANEENKPHFVKYISEFSFEDLMAKFFMQTKHVMLKHGDYRASNLMHKYNAVRFIAFVSRFVFSV